MFLFTNDESYSWRVTQCSKVDLLERTSSDGHPPLCYLLLKTWAALWGDSTLALRSLSVAYALLTVFCGWHLARRTCQGGTPVAQNVRKRAGLFTALLVGLHATTVEHALTARMYALGTLFAALTALLLWRAVYADKRHLLAWSLYGLATAAFAYTHYFAFFTLFAQGLFLAVYLAVRWRREGFAAVERSIFGVCVAAGVAILLYAPWIPILRYQMTDVHASFWIPDVTWHEARRVFSSWATGLDLAPDWEGDAFLLVWLACAGYLVFYAGWTGWFFLVQAAVPWVMCIAYSELTGRSIFLERCLAFANFALLCFIGISWARVPNYMIRVGLAAFFGATTVFGLLNKVSTWCFETPAIAQAAKHLKENYREGDVIWAEGAADVNRMRFYLAQEGLREVNLRCHYTPQFGRGHVVHVASLTSDDVFWGSHPEGKRIWKCGPRSELGGHLVPGMSETWRRSYEGPKATHYGLILFERGKK
ncbi:MAG: glycosyltransferase family 39 protein [Gemmataceae bacterium]|nr:glycosyltransferase family 39 protein [Gemmataceae bacterium]MCI0743268.1 glycosyltransferase family 39 protein [Gemmataceae bacterium]